MDPILEQKFSEIEDTYWWYVGKNRLVRDLAGQCEKLLDLGCGTGALFQQIACQTDSLFGIDFSDVAVARSRERVSSSGLALASVVDLPFQDGVFDTLIASEVLEHLPDDCQALSEWGRVLKPGGRLIATVPAHPHLWGSHDELCHHQRRYRKSELQAKISAAGFHMERISYTFSYLYPIMAILRPLRPSLRWPKSTDEPLKDDFHRVPSFINRILIGLSALEMYWLRISSLPIGASLITLARKR